MKHTRRGEAYSWLLLNTLTWGLAFVAVKPALDVTTPFRYLLYRYGWAVLFSLPILWFYLKGKAGVSLAKLRHSLPIIIVLELLGTTAALSLLYFGLSQTTAIQAGLLTTPLPIFVTLGGVLLLKERQQRHEWLGLGIAFIGTLWLTVDGQIFRLLVGTSFTQGAFLWGNVAILLHNILNLIYFPLAKKHYAKLPKFFVTTISFYVGLVTFMVLSYFELDAPGTAELVQVVVQDHQAVSVWLAGLYMAIFGSIIGLTAYIKGQDLIESSEASLFWYVQPAIGIPASMLFLGEKLQLYQAGALLVILIGVYWAERRRPAGRRHPT